MSRSIQRSHCKHSCWMCDPGKQEPGVPKPSDRRRMQDDSSEWEQEPIKDVPRCACGKPADWFYAPSGGDYCDACVPRGCSCNFDLEGNEYLDEGGRRLPCCEYMEYGDGK